MEESQMILDNFGRVQEFLLKLYVLGEKNQDLRAKIKSPWKSQGHGLKGENQER